LRKADFASTISSGFRAIVASATRGEKRLYCAYTAGPRDAGVEGCGKAPAEIEDLE
jgi:hypothetical protein